MSSAVPENPNSTQQAIEEAAEDAKKRKTFFSLGDGGVTATVGANGRLLRISRHFPGAKNGFCVDDPHMPEPWYVVSRHDTILGYAENPRSRDGIGPVISGVSPAATTMINDRWPTFAGAWDKGPRYELQYVASEGTIYQRFKFETLPAMQDNRSHAFDRSIPDLTIDPALLIRDLNFVDGGNTFNEARPGIESYDSDYKSYFDGHLAGECLIREHTNESEQTKCVLHIQVVTENKSFQFFKSDEHAEPHHNSQNLPPCIIKRKSATTVKALEDKPKSEFTTIILAYTLDYVPKADTSSVCLPSFELLSRRIKDLLQPYGKHSLTNDSNPPLDFFLRRNLEYILSVCSIPTPDSPNDEFPCIALTCGDVDGHRVAPAAGFHAFQFLLQAFVHFQRKHENLKDHDCDKASDWSSASYICTMRSRITRVCSGHVRWLFERIDHTKSACSPNYWVSGQEIDGWRGNPYLPQKALVDVPFQVIKACDWIDLMKTVNFEWPSQKLSKVIRNWITDLEEIDKTGHYAFRRYDDKPTQSFYLTDHALIWRAIKSAEKIQLTPEFTNRSPARNARPYSSSHLQRHIIKRFTTENPQSNKRTMAVTRSPIQNRFLLRSRDTALFTVMDMGFFDTPEQKKKSTNWQQRIDVWRNTIDCQKEHEYNDDIKWSDPRRFALSIIMARNQKPINSRSESKMYRHAMSVLLRASSLNGLFPGSMNDEHEPVSYEFETLRDTFWETVFEIPTILWKWCHETRRIESSAPIKKSVESPSGDTDIQQLILEEVKGLSRSSAVIGNLLKESSTSLNKPRKPQAPLDYSMKIFQPFNNIVDQDNIVELWDEWLYKLPTFFLTNGTKKSDVLGDASQEFAGFVVDVSKPKSSDKQKPSEENKSQDSLALMTTTDILKKMGDERTIDGSKKRFWTFSSTSPEKNEACVYTHFNEEKKGEEIRSFLDRHRDYSKFFIEETTAVLNTWTTEIHLSFYRLDLTAASTKRLLVADDTEEVPSLPVGEKGDLWTPLVRVAMGFRFEGDFFDRYWTCRHLEADLVHMTTWSDVSSDSSGETLRRKKSEDKLEWLDLTVKLHRDMESFLNNGHGNVWGKDSWQQRRVLELMLFGRIVQRMTFGAKEILDEAWRSLCNRSRIANHDAQRRSRMTERTEYDVFLITIDDFIISRKRIEQVQRVLRTVIGNLEENIAQISLWQSREEDRQAERPRWTFHDESRFRVIIQKLRVSNAHDILELDRILLKISKLEGSLAKKLEILRSDLEEKRGGETQLFTYVTVVFLPLGFATGLFSMSEAPGTDTLRSMVITAVVAFVTIALLGMVVKTILSANIIRLPEVTNWTSQDWSRWKADFEQRMSLNKPGAGGQVDRLDEPAAVDYKRRWKSMRRLRKRPDASMEDVISRAEPV